MTLATVTATSPLTVRQDGAASTTPAKLVGGSSYSPTVGGRVIVFVVAGRLYLLGSA